MICDKWFDVLAIHMANTACGRWWNLGMLADRDKRPAWAPYAEVPGG